MLLFLLCFTSDMASLVLYICKKSISLFWLVITNKRDVHETHLCDHKIVILFFVYSLFVITFPVQPMRYLSTTWSRAYIVILCMLCF